MNNLFTDIRAVIFDMDGVIINSEPIYFKLEQKLFADLGIELTRREHSLFVGMSMPDIWTFIKQKYQLPHDLSTLTENHQTIMLSWFRKTTELEPMEGLLEFMEILSSAKIKLAVASSSGRELVREILIKCRIIKDFEVIVCGDEVKNSKPDPEIFLLAAAKLGLSIGDCLIIEDSANGVKAALSAGMRCVGFNNPDSGNQDLSSAHIQLKSFRELINLFKSESRD